MRSMFLRNLVNSTCMLFLSIYTFTILTMRLYLHSVTAARFELTYIHTYIHTHTHTYSNKLEGNHVTFLHLYIDVLMFYNVDLHICHNIKVTQYSISFWQLPICRVCKIRNKLAKICWKCLQIRNMMKNCIFSLWHSKWSESFSK